MSEAATRWAQKTKESTDKVRVSLSLLDVASMVLRDRDRFLKLHPNNTSNTTRLE